MVEVELVIVALVPFRFVILPVVILAVAMFDVEALVVEAFRVAKFPVVPHKVPIVAEIKFARGANRLDNIFKLSIEEVAATI